MRYIVVIAALLAAVLPAAAYDLSASRPVKPETQVTPPPPDRDVLRQGGDTILSAVPIEIGDSLNGTTAGYINDYDEVCPYTGSMSPDVVYTFTTSADVGINVDTFGSDLDTKIYIYDQDLALVACNDDFYSDYTSRLENVPVVAGVQYFLVIDGYGGDYGVYTGYTEEFTPCIVDCWVGAQHENEPPLVDGYVDNWNGGCNTSPDYPFQDIMGWSFWFCGKTGYYLDASGESARDTDWFHIIIPSGGVLEITGDAEEASYMFELGPQDCNWVTVIQMVAIGPCDPATMTIAGPNGTEVWFWVGPQHYWEGATYEFDYTLQLPPAVEVEAVSWARVKGLFR